MKNINNNKMALYFMCLLLILSCSNADNMNYYRDTDKFRYTGTQFTQSITQDTIFYNKETIGGWLSIGCSQNIVISRFDNPQVKSESIFWQSTGSYVQKWEYLLLGVTLEMESRPGTEKEVLTISIKSPCKLLTSQGVGIGSSEEMVRKKYSKYIKVISPDRSKIRVGSYYGLIIFTLEKGYVSEIFIGALTD